MRRRHPDELTHREREVLELLRRDFTNEQIAHRLNISLDGAKYHVSQILSKLGVATREEAAALAVDERRRWWVAWPLWAKIAGAATAVAAVLVGLAVLWGALQEDGGEVEVVQTPGEVEVLQATCVVPTSIAQGSPRSVDEIFADIAIDVPEFGGFYFDESGRNLRVVLTQPVPDMATVCASLAGRSGMPRLAGLTVSAVSGEYSFRDLDGWYDPMVERMSTLSGVVSTDIDEFRNRLRVGIDEDAARGSVEQVLSELGIPEGAVIIEVTGTPVED